MLMPVLWPSSAPLSTASADTAPSITLCSGFDSCQSSGRSHGGYKTAKSKMYWNMYSGVNCTNYVAYRMIGVGMSATRPTQLKPGLGNATYWGGSFGTLTNSTPTVGAVAWWKANTNGVGSAGHVARVEAVLANGDIQISESNYGSEFTWRQLAKGGSRWPSGFIHLKDTVVTPTTTASIAGTPQVGVALTAKVGAWSPAPKAYSYQWFASGVAIPGATAATFVPTATQYARALQVRVLASQTGYVAGMSMSVPSTPVLPGTQVVTDAPEVSGTPQVDEVLTATPGAYSPGAQSTSVQWLADGQPISGATGTKFVPTAAQANARISLKVTAVRTGYKNLVKTSAATAPVLAPTIRSAAGTTALTGTRLVGQLLTASMPATVPANATRTYAWFRDGVRIALVTGPTYRLKTIDVGHKITASVTLSAKGYLGRTVSFPAVGGIATPLGVTIRTDARSSKSVWVKVILTPPGGKKPTGRVDVKVGTELRHAKITKNGTVRIHFTHPGAGTREVRVYFKGDSRFVTTRAQGTVKVPAAKKAKKRK